MHKSIVHYIECTTSFTNKTNEDKSKLALMELKIVPCDITNVLIMYGANELKTIQCKYRETVRV